MAQFRINVQAREDFVHSEPAQAFANIVHGESQQSHPTDLYQKVPFEDLTLNLITYNDYIASNSSERPLPIPNVNDLEYVVFELESLNFSSMAQTESSLDKYDPKFICTKNELGEYVPLSFNETYHIDVIKRGLFIHAQSYTPLARSIQGNMVLKYNFGYSNQTSISLTNNPFRLEINYGSLITANLQGDLSSFEYIFKQVNNIKESNFTDFKLQVIGEYDENGYNIPTHIKKPNDGTTDNTVDGLNFIVLNLEDNPIVGVRTNSNGINTSGSPQEEYKPVELSDYDPLQLGVTKKFMKKGQLLPDFTGLSDAIIVNIVKYVTVMNNDAYDDVTY